MWKSKPFSRGWLWQKRVWLRRNTKKEKKSLKYLSSLNYYLKEQKSPSVALKKKKNKPKNQPNKKQSQLRSETLAFCAIRWRWAAVTPHRENHFHQELSPASPHLISLSTTSQTAKSALPLSSVCQMEELSSLLAPPFLNYSICTAISSLHAWSWGWKTLGMFNNVASLLFTSISKMTKTHWASTMCQGICTR